MVRAGAFEPRPLPFPAMSPGYGIDGGATI